MQRLRRFISWPWVPAQFGKAPYVWSLSLLFFVWKYLYVPLVPLEAIYLALTLLIFLPLYFVSHWLQNLRVLPPILFSCLLGILWGNHNYGASSFFVFAAGMCQQIERPRLAYGMLVVVLAIFGVATLTLDFPSYLWIPALLVSVPVGISGIMDAERRRAQDKLLRKQEEVEHMATIAERERISRDLHDLLGHTLSLITIKAELAGKLLTRDSAACRQEIQDIENTARHALSEVRAAVTGYRQSGFSHELESARICLAACNIELQTEVQNLPLPALAENVFALTLREAVTNIVRHAKASRCRIALGAQDGLLILRVQDDGTALHNLESMQPGNGLCGMRERVKILGGELALSIENGLALELRIPYGERP